MFDEFVSQHFSAMNKAEVDALLCALCEVTSDFPKSVLASSGMAGLAELLDEVQDYVSQHAIGNNDLSSVKMQGRIEKYPLAALLCAPVAKSYQGRVKLLKSSVVVLSIQSFINENHSFHSSTLSAMRVVRMLNREKYFPLLAHLPKSFTDFVQLEEVLGREIEALEQGRERSPVLSWLKSLHQLTWYVNHGEQTRRNRPTAPRQIDKTPNALTVVISDPDEQSWVIRVNEPKLPRNSSVFEAEEIERRNHRTQVEIETQGETELAKVWRAPVANHILKRSVHLVANSELLTDKQIGLFLERSIQRNEDMDQLLLFVTLTGVLPNAIPKLELKEGKAEAMCLEHWLPTSSIKLQTDDVLKHIEGEFRLPCFPLSEAAAKLSRKDDIVKRLNQHLSEHYHLLGQMKITVHRLARVFPAFVQQNNHSSAIAELLTNRNKEKHVGLYYLSINTKGLKQLQQQYIDWLNQLHSAEPIELTGLELTEDCQIGSPLYIDLEPVKAWFEKTAADTNKTKNRYTTEELVWRHNAMTAYLHFVLALSTGERVNKQGFGYFDDYCLISGQCYISDKDTRSSPKQRRVSRVLVLPPLAVELLKRYQHWLKELCVSIPTWPDETKRHLARVLSNEQPFIFYLHKHTAVVESTKPFAHAQSLLPLPANWPRHWLRSYLEKQELSDSVIDAFMGHNRGFGLTQGRFSQLSFQDMKKVALVLQDVLYSLGVKVWQ